MDDPPTADRVPGGRGTQGGRGRADGEVQPCRLDQPVHVEHPAPFGLMVLPPENLMALLSLRGRSSSERLRHGCASTKSCACRNSIDQSAADGRSRGWRRPARWPTSESNTSSASAPGSAATTSTFKPWAATCRCTTVARSSGHTTRRGADCGLPACKVLLSAAGCQRRRGIRRCIRKASRRSARARGTIAHLRSSCLRERRRPCRQDRRMNPQTLHFAPRLMLLMLELVTSCAPL